MHQYCDEYLKSAKNEKQVKQALEKAFDKIEEDVLNVAKAAFDSGYPTTAYTGSCALVAVVIDNKLYVANTGDCKGVLLRRDPENEG